MIKKPILFIDIDLLVLGIQKSGTRNLIRDTLSVIRTTIKQYKSRDIVFFSDSSHDIASNKETIGVKSNLTRWADAMGIPTWITDQESSISGIANAIEAYKSDSKNNFIYILSSDPLLLQFLVDEKIRIVDLNNYNLIDALQVKESIGISPDQVTEFISIIGNSLRNISGMPSAGPQWVSKALSDESSREFQRLMQLKDSKIEYYKKNRLKTSVKELSNFSVEKFKRKTVSAKKIEDLYNELGLLEWIKPAMNKKDNIVVSRHEDMVDLTYQINSLKDSSIFLWLVKNNKKPAGLSFFFDEGHYYIPLKNDDVDKKQILGLISSSLSGKKLITVNHHELLEYFYSNKVYEFPEIDLDFKNATYTLNSQLKDVSIDKMIEYYLDIPSKNLFNSVDMAIGNGSSWTFEYSKYFQQIYNIINEQFDNQLTTKVYYQDIEKRLPIILQKMEKRGFSIDKNGLELIQENASQKIAELQDEVYQFSGRQFNISSPQQIAQVIYQDLKLQPKSGKKDTTEATLTELKDQHPIVEKILNFKKNETIFSKFIHPLLNSYNPETGSVHARLNQTKSSSGRLSCTNPPLQNIPTEAKSGNLAIRESFISKNGNTLVNFDYSQIELCILAHLSGDPILVKAFQKGIDVHSMTASEVFNKPLKDITSAERKAAKEINFGLIYGMSDYGLSMKLSISKKQASQYIQRYFEKFKGVRQYMDYVKDMAAKKGYVTTIEGRRIYYPEYLTSQGSRKKQLERSIMNAPIQGSAADLMKRAMVKVYNELELLEPGNDWMVMQIHDELIFEVPDNKLDNILPVIYTAMETAGNLSVKLTAKGSYGKSWGDLDKNELSFLGDKKESLDFGF